jgi:magnesium chelatase subunit I
VKLCGSDLAVYTIFTAKQWQIFLPIFFFALCFASSQFSLYSAFLMTSKHARQKSKADFTSPAKKQASSSMPRPVYPFTAIVGQEEMKLALLLNVIDQTIGGVMIMGHRGTGKSTAVRALADLLPPITKVKGCLYACDPERSNELCNDCLERFNTEGKLPSEKGLRPVVDLPLGTTEDRVCGTLDIERALVEGVKVFEPGLLAKANRGFLYIDEVNLLEDHLVDLLLDSAASGRNIVEREGISVHHPARFVLVGSGNPEEGELRPQMLDRFGLFTQIETIQDLDQRVEIMLRRERFEHDPEGFQTEMRAEQERLRKKIISAKKNHARVNLQRQQLVRIAELCVALAVDGHRGELTMARASRALAAFEGRKEVLNGDIQRVAVMSLRHRLRKDPLEKMDSGIRIEQALEAIFHNSPNHRRIVSLR